jgi:thiol-disulfide isomerase/thioredoxin
LSDSPTSIRILAFTSPTCHQCHKLQRPALHRLMEHHTANISIEEIDATTSPELTQRYQVLTLPTTVVLDATGRAHVINYGFTNTQRLLEQVDEVLAEITS